jgi:hypothetical protein
MATNDGGILNNLIDKSGLPCNPRLITRASEIQRLVQVKGSQAALGASATAMAVICLHMVWYFETDLNLYLSFFTLKNNELTFKLNTEKNTSSFFFYLSFTNTFGYVKKNFNPQVNL